MPSTDTHNITSKNFCKHKFHNNYVIIILRELRKFSTMKIIWSHMVSTCWLPWFKGKWKPDWRSIMRQSNAVIFLCA